MGLRRDFYPKYKAKKKWVIGDGFRPVYAGTVVYEKRGARKQWDALFVMQNHDEARERVSMLNDAVINQYEFGSKFKKE